MKTMKNYHDLYLKCGILLLEFRSNSLKYLSWDIMLKMTAWGLTFLEIPDLCMYIFFKKDKRGRIFYVFNRYSKDNNKYLKSYHPKQKSKLIIYLDVNNLYGYVMSKFLPTSGFK